MRFKYLIAASPFLWASLGYPTSLQPASQVRQSSQTSEWATLETTRAVNPSVPQLPMDQNESLGDHFAVSAEDDDGGYGYYGEPFVDDEDEFENEDGSTEFSRLLSGETLGLVNDPLLLTALDKCQGPKVAENPDCILALAEVFLGTNSHPRARRLALYELRARVASDNENDINMQPKGGWSLISKEQRETTALRLVERILIEEDQGTQRGAIYDIAAVVSTDIAFYGLDGCGSTLLSFFEQNAQSTFVQEREVLALMFSEILRGAGNAWKDASHSMQLVELVKLQLQDPESLEVTRAAVNSLASISRTVGAEDRTMLLALRGLIRSLIDTAVSRLEDDPETSVQTFLLPLQTLFTSQTDVLIPDHLTTHSQSLFQRASDRSVGALTRFSMLSILRGVLSGGRMKGYPELLLSIYHGLVEINGSEDEKSRCTRPFGFVVRGMLDEIASQLPEDLFVSIFSDLSSQFYRSQDTCNRREILLTMQRSLDSHSYALYGSEPAVASIWETLDAALRDDDTRVEETALKVLTSTCKRTPYCSSEDGQIRFIPVLLDYVETNPWVREDALFALFSLTAFFRYDMSLILPQFRQPVLQTTREYLPTISKESLLWGKLVCVEAMEEYLKATPDVVGQ